MSVTDKLKKTKKKVEETAKKKAYSEKPGDKNPAKVSDLVKMTPTKAIKGQGQTVTKSVPKAKNVTSQTQIRKQAIQKKWAQQEERARYIGLDHVLGRSPLYTLQRDNAIGRTVQDRLDYSKYLGTQKKELSDEEKREEVRERLNVIARRLKDAGQPLSSQDRKLSSRDQKLIQNAKTDYENAREQGNRALMEAAHKRAENIRKGYGYSGGTTGEDYISPDLSKEEIAMLTPEGQRRLKRAKMDLETAQKSGDERKIAEVEAAVARIIGNNANRKEGFKKVDGYEGGNGQPRSKEPIMSYQDWEDRAYEGVYSVMSAVPGSILSLVETSNQAIENDFREKNWDYINDKANRLYEYKAMLELAKKGDGNPEWGTVAQLEQQVRIAEIAEKMRSAGTTVDPNLPGQTFMRKSMEAQQKFMEGRTGVDKLLASAALSMGQMAPALAISAIPGVGPAVGAGIMGAQAAGSKAYELNERGVDPAESQLRGIVSGGIESLTEKIPISNLLKVVKAGGGASLLKTMAKQAGIEATEESISYAMNYAADVAYKDPEAKFSVKDLLESAAVGAISGGALSGGGALLGRAVTRNAGASGQAVTPVRQSQEETRADTERQIRDQAAAMLTGEAAVPETVRQTERTTQRDVPVAEILERAPVSGNVQQEMRNEAKTVNPTRIEVREQAGSTAMEPNSQVRQVLGQAQTSMLTRMANTLGDSGSKAIMAAWDNNGNPGQYAADFVRVYNRSLSGTTVGRIQAPASLTDAQVMAAYTAGQNDRMASLEQEKVNAKQAEVAGRNTAVYATVDGSEAGLVYDDYVRDVMDRDTAESVTTVAKQLGLRVQMVDSVAGGMANADIQGSVVQIEKNNPNPVRSLFGHEMTHRVQELAPESYRAFRDYVMQSEKAQEDVQRKIAEYRQAGVELSREAAMDEITADYAGEMIEDQNLLKRFIENNRSNRSLLRRFLTAVKDMARKLTGSYQKQANDAAALLEKAVEDASRQAGKLQANKNTAGKGGVKYKIKYDKNNIPFVVIETDILYGVPKSEWVKTVKENLAQKFPDGVRVGNNTIQINRQSRKEMTFSEYKKWLAKNDKSLYADKFRATNYADEIILASRGYINEGLKHARKDNIRDFARGKVLLRVGSSDYSADVVVGKTSSGTMLLYDIVNLEGTKIEERSKHTKQPNNEEGRRRGMLASDGTVTQQDGNVNGKFSLKGSDDYNLRKLQAENKMLRERVDYWKGQTKRTERVTTDKKSVAKATQDLIRQYGADIEVSDIQGDLQNLYDYMASGKDGENELTYSAARERAEGIADKLISNAVEREDELYQQYSDLRQFLKDTKLTVSEADRKGLADYADFRRRNFGRFNLSKGQMTNVDMVYKEMSERWPEFFDEEREGSISDQLYQIESVLDKVYQITEYNPFDMYTSQAVSGAANEILELFFDLPQTRATFADRQAAKLDREKAAGRRRLQEERERKNAKLEELRRKNRERVENVIQKERERRKKDLGSLKDQYQARDAAGRERRKERELRAKILRHANALSTKLLRPSDKQHIPENLRSSVASVLNSINLGSKYDKPGSITKRTQAFQELRLAYENILSESDQQIVVDPDLLANISEIESMKDTPLGALNLSQLTTVWNTLKAVEASISTANKLFGASKFETIQEVAEGLKADNGGKRDRGDYRGPIGAMDKLINAGMLTPESYFHRLGKTGEELFRMLRRAQDKHITIMQEAQEYTAGVIGKTNVRKLEKEVHHFELDGQAVDMTTAQIMSLYELTKRKQAQEHIMVGGIRVDSVNKGIKRTSMSDAVRVTPEQVSEIVSALTEEQISIADGLQKFMGGRLAQLGNEASMEVYGYEKFKEKNYFPIKVDSNQTITDQAKDAAAATISGRGFTKGTKPHANNAVMIRNIFDVYADHVTDMATYSAWLGAMENLQRVFNFKYRDAKGNVTGTVKGLIHRIFGNNGQAYWKKLTEDLNNGVHGVNDNPFHGLFGNYKASAIGANIRVFIQQPTSILRALDTISPGDFAAGLVKANPRTWSKVKKYAPIAVWKDWGYFDADTGRQMKSVLFGDDSKLAKVNNALMAPAGAMDSLAWSHVWNALEVETGRKHKELEKGSDAFYQKVAERFNEVIDHSQVVDGVLQRSQLMRSSDGVTKMATSFMSEPTKIFNMFTTAAYDLRKSQDHDVRRQAGKTMARTSVALLISFVANAAAQSLVDGLRDDDKDEDYREKFLQAFTGLDGDEESKLDSFKSVVGGNMVSAFNPFTYIPFVKDVVSLVEGYDVNRMDMESISKVILAMGQCCMSLFGDGKMTKQNAVINLIGELSRLLGTPVANIKRDAVAIINTWLNGTHNYKLQYEVAKFMYRIENKNNKNMFLDIAYMAWRDGDKDTFLEISQDLMDAFGDDVNGETIERAMRKRMENQTEEDANFQADQTLMDLVGLLPSYEEEEEEEAEFSAKNLNAKQYEQYSTQRASSYREYENAVTSNPVWATLDDEAKDKVISAMWKYAGQTALEEASDGEFTITESGVLKARAVAESGVDVGTFFIMKGVADAQEGVKTVDGVTISDSASYNKFKALRDSGVMDNLSAAQKEKVYDALEISSKVRSMNESAMNQLGQDIEAKKNEPSVFSVLGEDKTDFVKEFYDTCDSFSSSYDGNGKPIKGQGKQDKIIAEINKYSNLTRKEKSALYHMFYESDRNNPWA